MGFIRCFRCWKYVVRDAMHQEKASTARLRRLQSYATCTRDARRERERKREKERGRERIMPINGIEIERLAERLLDRARTRSLVCISRAFRRGEVGEPRRVTLHAIVDTLTTTLRLRKDAFSCRRRRVVLLHCRQAWAICDLRHGGDKKEERGRGRRRERSRHCPHSEMDTGIFLAGF